MGFVALDGGSIQEVLQGSLGLDNIRSVDRERNASNKPLSEW